MLSHGCGNTWDPVSTCAGSTLVYTKTFICKAPYIKTSSGQRVQFLTMIDMSIPTNKNLAAKIAPCISSALRDLKLGKILFLFSQALIQKFTVPSWHCHQYTILNKLLGLGFTQKFFHDIIFSYYLTATRTLNFGYIKWTPDVAFTGSLLDIVFGQYFRQEMGKKTTTKTVEWVCHCQFLLGNLAHGFMSVL